MIRRCLFRAVSLMVAASVVLINLASCGQDKKKEAPTVTFRIMSWNEDFRDLMETYFVPRHAELMEHVRLEWVTDEINGYRQSVQRKLAEGEQIDLFLGDNEMAPYFAEDDNVASLAQVGITDDELSAQFGFTRVLGSDSNGMQKGSAFTAEPGILLYRTDYAEKYLGITHQEEMQEKLSSWDTFISVARTLNEQSGGKIKMLPSSAELWKSVDCAMYGLWLTDGKLSVSDTTALHWLDIVKELESVNAFAGAKSLDDDWYTSLDSGVFCFYAAPWLCKSNSPEAADITTIFSSTRRSGASFGKFRTSLAPNGFVYGGRWLYCPKKSGHKDIAAEIIRAFSCDRDFMKLIALGEMQYVNNSRVCDELAGMKIPNMLFDGLDAFSVYNSAARSLEFSAPTVYDSSVSGLLYDQTKKYAKGEVTGSEAVDKFRQNVWKKHEEIAEDKQYD